MNKPRIADNRPIVVELKAGTDYWYCTCGQSNNQPFCDGSHIGSGFEPQKFQVDKDQEGYLCQCKRSARQPFCDGAHKRISKQELDEQSLPKPRIDSKLL